jgi:hypothetical protein
MHDPNSPHHQFDPSSVGWLHRRAKNGENITNPDLIRVIQASPNLIPDKLLRDYIINALIKPLNATPGPKPRFPLRLKNYVILEMYEDLVPRLQKRAERRKRNGYKKGRADYAPSELASVLLGRRFRKAPGTILNIVSSLNSRG